MEYNLLICTSTEKWIAIDINPNGELERLSLDGNDFAEVNSTENVLEFCSKILDYYKINKFNLNLKIVMVSKYSPLNLELFMQLKDAASVNLIDAKTVMPIYVLKNCLVKANRKIGIFCMEERFSIIVDDDLTVSYEDAEEGEELRIEPESFSIVFSFNCKNLISDEREFKKLEKKHAEDIEEQKKEVDRKKKEIIELKEKNNALKNDLETLEQQYNSANTRIEEFKVNIESRREIIRFDSSKFESSSALRLMSLVSNIDYQVKILKSEGDIIERGTDIISFLIESASGYYFTRNVGTIATESRGKIHYLVKNVDVIHYNYAVAILSDPLDERKDVLQWYQDRIAKECGEERKSPKRKKKP